MSGFLSKTLCLGIGAALGAGITYLAMKEDSAPVSDDADEVSDDAVETDDLMSDEGESHLSANAQADDNSVQV